MTNAVRTTLRVVGTTHTAIAAGDVTDDAFAVIVKLSEDETVTIGGDDSSVFEPWFSIPPGYLMATGAGSPLRIRLYKIVEPA